MPKLAGAYDRNTHRAEHNDGKASKYTRTRQPVKLLYCENCAGRAEALTREYKVKSLSRKAKEKLVSWVNINN